MPQTDYTFPKAHRLKGQKNIENLLRRARSYTASPFRVFWTEEPAETEGPVLQVAISVSKKNIKKAVRRNLIKRRFREAYRIASAQLSEKATNTDRKIRILFVYRHAGVLPFTSIQQAVMQCLKQIESTL